MALLEFAKHFAAKDELGGLGEKEIYDTIRFYTMSIRDYLDEYFESDITKAHLAGSAIIGTALGPCSPGSADITAPLYGRSRWFSWSVGVFKRRYGLYYKSNDRLPHAHGGEVKPDNEVVNVITKNGRAIGVATKKGDEYYAKIVSNLDVKRTFLKLLKKALYLVNLLKELKTLKLEAHRENLILP